MQLVWKVALKEEGYALFPSFPLCLLICGSDKWTIRENHKFRMGKAVRLKVPGNFRMSPCPLLTCLYPWLEWDKLLSYKPLTFGLWLITKIYLDLHQDNITEFTPLFQCLWFIYISFISVELCCHFLMAWILGEE